MNQRRRSWRARSWLARSSLGLSWLALVGCGAQIVGEGGGGGGDECGERPAIVDGPCPSVWECVDGEWREAPTDCAVGTCPALRPADGEPCEPVGLECAYDEEVPCGPQHAARATCTAEGWLSVVTYCQPEPTCPDSLPPIGGDCTGWDYGYDCPYEIACAELATVTVVCDMSAPTPTWKVEGEAPACGSCALAADPSSCSANPGCTWYEPGCASDGETAIARGCYPSGDCRNELTCPNAGEECVPFVFDPCAGSQCDACGATIGVCVAP
jgi:hypothetical protein